MNEFQNEFSTIEEFNNFVDEIFKEVVKTKKVIENKVFDRLGRAWDLDKWVSRSLRSAVANDLLDTTRQEFVDYDIDLCFSSYLADSSDLCLSFQNSIYATNIQSAEATGYPLLDTALWINGGGLIHPNCRHTIDPYFEGITELEEAKSDRIISANYNARQEWLKCNNRYDKLKKELDIYKKNGIEYTNVKKKADIWLKRRNNLPNPIDSAFDVF